LHSSTIQNSQIEDADDRGVRSSAEAGKIRRLSRLLSANSHRTVIVPVDDSLIFGPTAGLEHLASKIQAILSDPPNAVLTFPGLLRSHAQLLSAVGLIVNLTASTGRSQHTRKVQVGTVEHALRLGVDAVAAHVNITSNFESEMIRVLGSVSEQCDTHGMPLLAIMYPRSEVNGADENYDQLKETDRKSYAELVAHAARVGVDLGADIIKTKYTGDPDSFRLVVEAAMPVPVVVAGGPALSPEKMLQVAYEVVSAGGGGISFGRNVFSRTNPGPFVAALKAIVHEEFTVAEALSQIDSKTA